MKKITAVLVMAALLTVGTALVSAATFGDRTGIDAAFSSETGNHADSRKGMFIRRILNRIADRLNLTPEQRSEIREILQDARTRLQPLVMQAAATRNQIKELGRDGSFDEARVNQLAAEQANTVRQLIIEKEKVKAQIFAVLTTEQRAEAEKMQSQFENKIRERIGQNF